MSETQLARIPWLEGKRISVCIKPVDLHPVVLPGTSSATRQSRRIGITHADAAAIEVGIRLAEASGASIQIVAAGPSHVGDSLLEAAAAAQGTAVRISVPFDEDSSVVAAELAECVAGSALVICGAYSGDRGTGSVPGFLAHECGIGQALGLTSLSVAQGELRVVRRLDGGAAEILAVSSPAVCSVEGSVVLDGHVCSLRRASLERLLELRAAGIEQRSRVSRSAVSLSGTLHPFLPRTRLVAPPQGGSALDRIVELTGALAERVPPRRVEATPEQAATLIIDQLVEWGYLDPQ